jgi:hypothetical protein
MQDLKFSLPAAVKNAVFSDMTPCGSCKNKRGTASHLRRRHSSRGTTIRFYLKIVMYSSAPNVIEMKLLVSKFKYSNTTSNHVLFS